MESEYGEDGKCVGVRCAMAQGGSCGVRTHGKTRFRTRDAPTRGTVTWVPSLDTATEYSHRALSRGFRHGTQLRGHFYRVLSQGTIKGHQSQGTATGHQDGSLIRKSLPRLNITAAYKQRHPG